MEGEMFPVLFINSPSTTSPKVELPGDPVSILYAGRALFSSLERGTFNSKVRPKIIENNGQIIYDPRIWNERKRREFKHLLEDTTPLATFFCTYSPSHSYGLDIAREVKSQDDNSLIVFGGKHQDETLSYGPNSDRYDLKPCNTLRLISEEKVSPLVDMVVSGEGEIPLKFINEEIGRYIYLKGDFDIDGFLDYFLSQEGKVEKLEGKSVIGFIKGGDIKLIHTSYRSNPILEYDSPYNYFPVRTKNPIFSRKEGDNKLTTNIITSRSCKNSCVYCSEGTYSNNGPVLSKCERMDKTLERVIEDIEEGAEAAFFDDSIFFQGNLSQIQEFVRRMIELKKNAKEELESRESFGLSKDRDDFLKRLCEFEYGVQFCVEDIVGRGDKGHVLGVLNELRESGCSYVYVGIESLDDRVMRNVQKFNQLENRLYDNWFEKVRTSLSLFQEAGIRVGASIQFGIPGETMETVKTTISRVKQLLEEERLCLVSPNLCTYHPGTPLTKRDGRSGKLDYVTVPEVDGTMSFFEEASPGHISKRLTSQMLKRIKKEMKGMDKLNSQTIQDE